MRDRMLKFIGEKKLFRKEDRLIVAVSGGADSIALCHLLSGLNYKFVIAHCNFQLRESESDDDELFVKEVGKSLGVEVFVKRFDSKKIVEDRKQSIQMVARELRYKWFEELRKSQKCDYLVTAHHKNDSLETVLLNFTKGTGIAGLHGIKPKNGVLVRPLLFATKEEILKYLKKEGLQFREDSSNRSDKYQRNLIRNQVIGSLKKINPALEETFDNFIERITQTEEIFSSEISKFKFSSVKETPNGCEIEIKSVLDAPGGLIKLYEVLNEYEFNFSQVKVLFNALKGSPGKLIESRTYVGLKDRSKIIVFKKGHHAFEPVEIGSIPTKIIFEETEILFEEVDIAAVTITENAKLVLLDFDKLTFPLLIRNWTQGDYFVPLGMKGKKKISDYLIDKKIPVPEKAEKKVLSSNAKIAWLVGERIDDRFKITSNTKKVLRITLSKVNHVNN